MEALPPADPTTTAEPRSSRPLAGLLAGVADLVRHLSTHVNRIAEDVARDAGDVARDADAFGRAAMLQWSQLRDGARATPRLSRVIAEGAKVLALWRWHRLRALARGEDPVDNPTIHRALARATRDACIELRGGILKLGQIASCRPDLLPPAWLDELSQLQDRVPPVPTEEILAAIEAELGAPIAERFAEVATEALAAASLAQVHAARALHGDAELVIKVQVPGIAEVIEADIAALRVLARLARDVLPGVDLAPIVTELATALTAELDYRAEADNLRDFAAAARATGDPVVVPTSVPALSTGRILTMQRIGGERLTDALDRLVATGDHVGRDRVCATIVSSVARQVFAHGVIHADPHPGNFLVTPDGNVAVLDFGCVLRLDDHQRRAFARLFAALIGRDEVRAAAELRALGFVASNEGDLLAMAATIVDAMRPGSDAAEIDWNDQLVRFTTQLGSASRAGASIRVPPAFVMLSRVLATLAGLLVRYRPRLQPFALIAPFVAAAATSRAAA